MFTRIITALARSMRNQDLSIAQLAALHILDQHGELQQSVLPAELGRSASAASRLVDGLVRRGLVERRESEDDRRARTLRLSARGHELIEQLGVARVQLFERITRPLPRAIVTTLVATIERAQQSGIDVLADEPSKED